MSLFGLMGDLDDDPLMGGHVRRMNSLMSSFFRDPFADMFGGGRGGMLSIGGPPGLGGEMMPFTGNRTMHSPAAMMLSGGFPSLLDQLGSAGSGAHMSSMSTVMTMTQGPDGRPQVYQASQTVRQGPNGVRETKKTVADSRTGVKKMSIGRHVYDRGHIVEREQNIYSGEREENEEFINLDEDEAEDFKKEWETKARQMMHGRNGQQPAIGYGNHSGSHRRRHHNQQLALPPSTNNPPQPSHRLVGRSSRRSTYGLTSQAYQPSVASKIAASLEINDSDSEEEPCKKRKLEDKNENITNSITINQTDDEEEEDDDIDENDDVIEEVDDEEDDEDEVEEVIDLDSDSVLSKDNKINKQI